jgi:hypothetical protein
LSCFIKEAGLPVDVGASTIGSVTIEQILQEKKTFDLSLKFEKLGVKKDNCWRDPGLASFITFGELLIFHSSLSSH